MRGPAWKMPLTGDSKVGGRKKSCSRISCTIARFQHCHSSHNKRLKKPPAHTGTEVSTNTPVIQFVLHPKAIKNPFREPFYYKHHPPRPHSPTITTKMSPKDTDAIKSLESLVQTASTLLTQLQAVLSKIHKTPESEPTDDASAAPDPNINALSLAHDSASLIRAHGTKISLLIINEPFTPSAVSTVLRELVAGPIPGLASSVQACTSKQYTAVVRKELAWRAQRVLAELDGLLHKVPKDGKVLTESKRGGFSKSSKGSLPATGLLWQACDNVIDLSKMGVGGFFIQKVHQWRDTINDVMEELKEWGDEEPASDEDDEDDDDDDNDDDQDDSVNNLADQLGSQSISTQAMLDSLMDSQQTIPASDPDKIRPRLETSLKRLRLVTLLYQALTKRRLQNLPSFPPSSSDSNVPSRLDEMANLLARLPESFGDLAIAFYDLQPAEIDKTMDQCFFDAFAASELFSRNWDGGRDVFSEWTDKFQTEIKKV